MHAKIAYGFGIEICNEKVAKGRRFIDLACEGMSELRARKQQIEFISASASQV